MGTGGQERLLSGEEEREKKEGQEEGEEETGKTQEGFPVGEQQTWSPEVGMSAKPEQCFRLNS
jgi:hypothetical protein